jgi:hypothetical protein
MNIRIVIGGADYTDSALLDATRISFDSSRRVTTASVTVLGPAVDGDPASAVYDEAVYDQDVYAFEIDYLAKITIYNADATGSVKLFEGSVLTQTMKQTDSVDGKRVLYQCDCNDYAAWLDRSIAADIAPVPMPSSDQYLIQRLVGDFCAQVDATRHVDQLAPAIYSYQWQNKTCRQILDDICAITGGQWYVDFDGVLWYGAILGSTQAPFGLSTLPDMVSTFPVRVDSWRKDFSNPVNRAYVRGAAVADGFPWTQGWYDDPVSIQKYGTLGASIVDTQLTSDYDCQLRAKTTVLQYSEPVEQGSFVVWKDGLALGQTVHIREDSLGIDGDYIIRALAMAWKTKDVVEYAVQFGAKQPDLESFLRMLDQRTKWASALVPASIPAPGSVTDSSIASGGLSASSINSVSAGTIQGLIQSDQIGSVGANTIIGSIQASQIAAVNASVIQGAVTAGQIATVNASSIQGSITAGQIGSVAASSITGSITASQITSIGATQITGLIQSGQIGSVGATTIQGAITAGQIGSVSATVIQGVVVSSQLADGIIDDLAKYAAALRPVPMLPNPPVLPNGNNPAGSYYYLTSTGHFYQVSADGLGSTDAGANPDSLTGQMKFYTIGALSAQNINGLILAAQIGSVNATTINGQIQAAQISSVSATAINGLITASQIDKIRADQITGQLVASQVTSITAGQITGTLTAAQIGAVNASAIAGLIQASQINTVGAAQITGSIQSSQIASITAGQITGVINGGQINSIVASTITVGTLADSQIGTVSGGKIIAGTVTSDKLSSVSIDVGGGSSGKPGVFNVYDASNNIVGRVGTLTGSFYGGWFKVFGAGGTSYTDAVVKTDTGGNLSITNAAITITHSASATQIATSPTTFYTATVGSYSSIALNVSGGSDKASLVSRGLVVTSTTAPGNNQVGALVRDPTYTDAGVLTLLGGGNINIALTGHDGIVQASGFKCGGNAGIGTTFYGSDGASQWLFTVAGGIITSNGGSPVSNAVTVGPVNLLANDGKSTWSLYWKYGLMSAANFYQG